MLACSQEFWGFVSGSPIIIRNAALVDPPAFRMKDFGPRWQDAAGTDFIDRLISMGRSGSGFSVSESPFGFTESGLLDLRGLRIARRIELRRVTFAPADFEDVSFEGLWFERCAFNNAKFDRANFQSISEHGNEFIGCIFLKSSFRGAAIGFRGSHFESCSFECVNFRKAVFVRPEFDGCEFYRCKFDGCDLNGSSFERCRFVGALRDVWFRGGFAHPDDVSQYGIPRVNLMAEVSFECASLRDVTFSNGCDLSSVKVPSDERHKLVGRWPEKLRSLQVQSKKWSAAARDAADVFAATNLTHARGQEWFILNRDDLEVEFGDEVADLIWKSFSS